MEIFRDRATAWQPWMLALWFVILFVLERVKPLRERKQPGWGRLGLNAVTTALALGAAALTVSPVMAASLDLVAARRIGVLQWWNLPAPVSWIAAFLLLDMSFYYWHRLNHTVNLLWRFHNVHHIDTDLDSTTSFRFHFGEIAYSSVFRVVQITLIGPGMMIFVVYETVFLASTLFHHSNVRLPARWERIINYVFITPRMHGVHHSKIKDETNANYSVVFRWWDMLHRSLRLNVDQSDIDIGVAAYTVRDNSISSVLLLPFASQREYWRTPTGAPSFTRPHRDERARGAMTS
jgi:sterol desaturase/sphingolipid hydroxylase (fatty acid hydroxylase superfamily)